MENKNQTKIKTRKLNKENKGGELVEKKEKRMERWTDEEGLGGGRRRKVEDKNQKKIKKKKENQ